MAVNDVYEVTDVQELAGQQILNVYFYQQRAAFAPSGPTIAQVMAEEWRDTVLPVILLVQQEELVHQEIRVRNLFNPTDAGVAVSGAPGDVDVSNDFMSTFNAFGFGLNTDNASIRPGAKRIGGVGEGSVVDGVASGVTVGLLNDVADAIAAPIQGGLIISDDIMFPVVVKRVRSGSPGNYEYRLPENTGENVVGLITEVLVNLLITSQVSRKIGFGV